MRTKKLLLELSILILIVLSSSIAYPEDAQYSTTFTTPYCATGGSPCIAGSSLLKSVDSVDTPEPNEPNTLDSCADGTGGSYLSDESVENITITDYNNSQFRPGDTVGVTAWVHCYSTSTDDQLGLVYTNNSDTASPDWKVKHYISACPTGGLNKITFNNFTLDNRAGNHSVRVYINYDTSPDSTITCGAASSGTNYADNDDLTFLVIAPNQPPSTPTTITCNGGNCNNTFSETVNINCSGSTDTEGDTITYNIEAFMQNTTNITNDTAISKAAKGQDNNLSIGQWRDTAGTFDCTPTVDTWTGFPFNTQDKATTTYTQNANDIDINIGETGHYLVLYGLHFTTDYNGRIGHESRLTLDGTPIYGSYSSGYSRNTNNDDEFMNGGAIINATAGQNLRVEIVYRTSNGDQVVTPVAGDSYLQIIKLDDSWDYFRAHETTGTTMTEASWNPITWEAEDEKDIESFNHTSNSDTITIKKPGHYLVIGSYGVTDTDSRGAFLIRATLNSNPIPTSYSYEYIRDNNGHEEGNPTFFTIIEANSDDTLKIEARHDFETSTATETTLTAKTGVMIVALPDGDYYRGYGTSTIDPSPSTSYTQLDMVDTEAEEDTNSFSGDTTGRINMTNTGEYLIFFSGEGTRATTTNTARDTTQIKLFINDTESSFGGGWYDRGDQSSTGTFEGGTSFGTYQSLKEGEYVDFRGRQTGDAGDGRFSPNQYGITTVNLAGLFKKKPTNETNSSYTTYTNMDGEYDAISNITVKVETDAYNPEASVQQSTNRPDLELEMWNSSDWVGIGNFNLPSKYGGTSLDTTNHNLTLTTTDTGVLTAWQHSTGQNLRIRAIYMDYYNETLIDEINYTNIWVQINGNRWQNIGNHTEGNTLLWNLSGIPEQTGIDLKCKAIDIGGSDTYSSYYDPSINLTITSYNDQPPYWSNNQTSIATTYSPTTQSQFNITWQDDNQLSTAWLELNYTGTAKNYTMNNIATNTYNYAAILPAGTFYWKSYANDSADQWNNTDTWQFTINKASTSLSLSSSPSWSETYGVQTNVTCEADNPEVTVSLWRNDTLVGSAKNSVSDVQSLAVGNYSYVCNTSGSVNYTSAEVVNTLVVVPKTHSSCDLSFNPLSGQVYPVSLNATCVCDNPEAPAKLYRNGNDVTLENGTLVFLSAGTYDYVCNVSETTHYAGAENSSEYLINKAAGEINLYLNGSENNLTIYNNTLVNISASLVSGTGNIQVYKGGVKIYEGPSPSQNITLFDALGQYNITAIYSGNQNYTADQETWWVTVLAKPIDHPPNTVLNNPPTGYYDDTSDPANVTFNCSATDDNGLTSISLYLTDSTDQHFSLNNTKTITGTSNSTSWTLILDKGNYTWNCLSQDTGGNNAFATNNRSIKINYTNKDTTPPIVNLNSPTEGQTFTTTNNVTFSVSSTDDTELKNCTLWTNTSGNWKANETRTFSGTSDTGTWNLNLLMNGTYIWNVNCCDNSSNCAWNTTNRTFEVAYTPQPPADTTPPATITNLQNISATNTSIFWNWTNPSDADFDATIIYIDSVNEVNLSSGVTSYNATGFLPNTTHTITIHTKDTTGNVNTTDVSNTAKTLPTTTQPQPSVDVTPPTVNLNSPADNQNLSDQQITFNCHVADNMKVKTVRLYGDWSGWSAKETDNSGINDTDYIFIETIADGTYNWNCQACDNSSNCDFATTNRTFKIDTTPPTITNVHNTSITNSSAVIIWNTDEISNSSVAYGNTMILGLEKNLADNVTSHSISINGLTSNTTYYYNITSCDDLGNCRTEGTYNFTTTTTPDNRSPAITNVQAGQITDHSSIISWDTDEIANSTVNYGTSQGLGTIKAQDDAVTEHNISLTGLQNNTQYYYNVTSCDPSGNCNTTGPYSFTTIQTPIDNPPNVSLTSPEDNYNSSNGGITFKCEATDDNQVTNITLYNNISGTWQAKQTKNTNTLTYTETNIPEGTYIWNCQAYDDSGNMDWGDNNRTVKSIKDSDHDGVQDKDDTLEGTRNNVVTSGVGNLGITVGGNSEEGTFNGEQEVLFYDGSELMMNFTHNFSASTINLSEISIELTPLSIVIHMPGQLRNGETKALSIKDNNFISLCVKDSEITTASQISAGCDGTGETDFTSCLGNSTGVRIGNLTCYERNNRLTVINLTHSGIEGTQAPTPTSTTGSGTGGGGGYYCDSVWHCTEWSRCTEEGTRTRTCTDIRNCPIAKDKPPEAEECSYIPAQKPPKILPPEQKTKGEEEKTETIEEGLLNEEKPLASKNVSGMQEKGTTEKTAEKNPETIVQKEKPRSVGLYSLKDLAMLAAFIALIVLSLIVLIISMESLTYVHTETESMKRKIDQLVEAHKEEQKTKKHKRH